jgi:hypothetical protein
MSQCQCLCLQWALSDVITIALSLSLSLLLRESRLSREAREREPYVLEPIRSQETAHDTILILLLLLCCNVLEPSGCSFSLPGVSRSLALSLRRETDRAKGREEGATYVVERVSTRTARLHWLYPLSLLSPLPAPNIHYIPTIAN